MNLTKRDRAVVEELLDHDLKVFARTLNFRRDLEPRISDQLATEALNLCERLSRRAVDDATKNACVLACGLLWEHRRPEWAALPAMLVTILSRLGLPPAARMVDAGKGEDTRFRSLGSLRAELEVTAHHELYTVTLGEGRRLTLTRFQRDLWHALDAYPRVGVSAPTSAGKSFVLARKIANTIDRARTVVYIVPTVSLIQQVTRDIREALEIENAHARVTQTFIPDDRRAGPTVYVLTQERAYAALAAPDSLRGLGLLVVDEIQNLERTAEPDDERARLLQDVVHGFRDEVGPAQIVIAGPRLKDVGEFTRELLGDGAMTVSESLPPVVNVTYSFAKSGEKIELRQYAPAWPGRRTLLLATDDAFDARVFGQTRYTERLYGVMNHIVTAVSGSGGTLVFSPTSSQARRTALHLTPERAGARSEDAAELAEYLRATVHPAYDLASVVERGVGYHHGKMSPHARIAMELAFAEGTVSALACTTTLLQGVNLPAKTLIARNPNLFVQRGGDEGAVLSSYEFANLRGRAGRLLKDFLGRAVVLDEGMFVDAQVGFEFPEKRVKTGFGERFDEERSAVLDGLTRDEPHVGPGSDLTTYVRHAILRFGDAAAARLAAVGIKLTPAELRAADAALDGVDLPLNVLRECRTWDPLLLAEIQQRVERGDFAELPRVAYSPEFTPAARRALHLLRNVAPSRYEKLTKIPGDRIVDAILITAERWARELPLNEILKRSADEGAPPDADEIEERLERLFSHVTYKLPQILRPIVLFQDPENPLLGFLELGAHKPLTRTLIEAGLPREVAIAVSEREGAQAFSPVSESEARQRALPLKPRLRRWEQRIFDASIGTG